MANTIVGYQSAAIAPRISQALWLIRVFSSIVGVHARPKGEDAIRVMLVVKYPTDLPRIIWMLPRVYRTDAWATHLKTRVTEALEWVKTHSRFCPKCGSAMAVRQSKTGQFYGCLSYPACQYTANYTQS